MGTSLHWARSDTSMAMRRTTRVTTKGRASPNDHAESPITDQNPLAGDFSRNQLETGSHTANAKPMAMSPRTMVLPQGRARDQGSGNGKQEREQLFYFFAEPAVAGVGAGAAGWGLAPAPPPPPP